MKSEYKLESFSRPILNRYSREMVLEHMKSIIEKRKNLSEHLPDCKSLKTFIKRFIMRCLPAEIDKEDEISRYITRSDLWKINYKDNKLETLKAIFSNEIHASHSLLFYEIVQQELSDRRMSDKDRNFPIWGEMSEDEGEENEGDEGSEKDERNLEDEGIEESDRDSFYY